MSAPNTWEDTLRAHDMAVSNWLGNLHVDYVFSTKTVNIDRRDFPILRIFSTPQRAFATIVDFLVRSNFIDAPSGDTMRQSAGRFDVLPLPICTIHRGDPVLDPELSAPAKTLRNQQFDPVTQSWIIHPWPGHYRTDYTVTLWSVKTYSDNFMREWVMSYFGANPGASYSECMLPVQHVSPWGLMKQSFKLVGTSDLSDLEGETQRYRRTEFSFSLRTWLFRDPSGPGGTGGSGGVYKFIDRIGTEAEMVRTDYNGDLSIMQTVESGNLDTKSMNLFLLPPGPIPASWPKTGVAQVSRAFSSPDGRNNGLTCVLISASDSVQFAAGESAPGQGYSILSASFQYKSDAASDFQVWQRDPVTGVVTEAFTLRLPARSSWTKVHIFTLAIQPSYTVSASAVAGEPTATVTVVNLDIRRLDVLGQLAPEIIDAGTEWHYVWRGLPGVPALVVATVVSTGGARNVSVDNDADVPTVTREQIVSDETNAGVVTLIQPISGSIRMRVAKAVSLANVGLQRYADAYNGHEL